MKFNRIQSDFLRKWLLILSTSTILKLILIIGFIAAAPEFEFMGIDNQKIITGLSYLIPSESIKIKIFSFDNILAPEIDISKDKEEE